jgi:hypothetical protein
MGFSGVVISQRREAAMGRMAPLAVVEHCDRLQHCCLDLRVRVTGRQMHACSLSGMKATRRNGVVPTGALAAPPRRPPVVCQELPRAVGALLTPPVRMPEEARSGRPLAARPRQGVVAQFCPHRVRHCPPDHRPRAQSPPARARRERGNISNVEGIGCLPSQLPVALVRGHRLGLQGRRRRGKFPPGVAAQTRLGQHAPDATAAALQALLRQQRLDAACAVGPTALCNILLAFRLHLLLGIWLGTRGPAEPRVVATPRDLQGAP